MAYKEKDTKKWSAQWFETTAKGEKKKRRKRGFETKREALEYERQKKLSSSRSMDMKLSEFMEVYFEDKQNELKDRTMKNKRYMMEQHIIPYFGEQMLSEITASQIIQWQNEMQTKGFSESYLRMIQNQLTCIFTVVFQIKRAANLQIILAPYKIDVVLQPHYPETLLHITRTKILPCKLIAQEYSVSSYENGSSFSSIWQA